MSSPPNTSARSPGEVEEEAADEKEGDDGEGEEVESGGDEFPAVVVVHGRGQW